MRMQQELRRMHAQYARRLAAEEHLAVSLPQLWTHQLDDAQDGPFLAAGSGGGLDECELRRGLRRRSETVETIETIKKTKTVGTVDGRACSRLLAPTPATGESTRVILRRPVQAAG